MVAATKQLAAEIQMPRACPLELHVGGYQTARSPITDATGLSPGASRWRLPNSSQPKYKCHGLVPWSFTFAATKQLAAPITDATGLSLEPHASCSTVASSQCIFEFVDWPDRRSFPHRHSAATTDSCPKEPFRASLVLGLHSLI